MTQKITKKMVKIMLMLLNCLPAVVVCGVDVCAAQRHQRLEAVVVAAGGGAVQRRQAVLGRIVQFIVHE